MNDYEFGNYIYMLRTGLCLSQFQLGSMVGVTDKAVSKWENGSARPRIDTCRKLANALGVSVDELLGHSKKSAGDGELEKEKQELLLIAEKALHEKYGPNPSLECVGRLQSEISAIEDKETIRTIRLLGVLADKAAETDTPVTFRGTYGSLFTVWLLGGSRVNPLPPHYYCPFCHRFETLYSARDGWDLPEKICCKRKMTRDGHRISFEGHIAGVKKLGASPEMTVPHSFEVTAEQTVRSFFRDSSKVIPVRFLPEDNHSQDSLKLAVFPNKGPVPSVDDTGMWKVSVEEFYTGRHPYMVSFIFSDVLDDLEGKRKKAGYVPLTDSLLTQDNLTAFRKKQYAGLSELANLTADDIGSFELILKTEGFIHGTNVLTENEMDPLKNRSLPVKDLLSLREDVWDEIISRIHPGSMAGSGFALKVMEETRKGLYARKYHGIPEETERLLKEIGISENTLSQMKHILYMFPRSHCIEFILIGLELEYFNGKGLGIS